MFGDKLAAANARITGLVAIIVATGLQVDAAALGDATKTDAALPTADQMKAHLAQREQLAVTAAVTPLNGQIKALEAQISGLTAKSAEADLLRQGIADAGIKLADFTSAEKAEGKTAEEKAAAAKAANVAGVKLAVETAISARAAKQVAAAGHPNAIEVPPGGPKADASATPQSKEEFMTTLNGITDPGARQAYFRKHKALFPLS